MSWLILLSLSAFAWPEDADWVVIERGGIPLTDGVEESVELAPELDLMGSELIPAAHWYADSEALYLRMRIRGEVVDGSGQLRTGDRGFFIEGTGDGVFDSVVLVGPGDGSLRIYPNTTGFAGVQPEVQDLGQAVVVGDVLSEHVRVVEGGANIHLLDLQIPREELVSAGFSADAPLSLTPVTATSIYLDWVDLGGCDQVLSSCALVDAQADAIRIDRDLDGLTDPIEGALGTDPGDADTDDDGRLDGAEAAGDTDSDGSIDALDCDSDGDGVRDSVEAAIAAPGPDTDPAAGCFIADADPTSGTDPAVGDTDGGGLPDGLEDVNRDGALSPWETDPTDPADDLDTDGDAIADVLELLGADGQVDDEDSDGDGLPDADEWLRDRDGDGVPAFLDDDSDGDGLLDAEESLADTDGDGLRNFEDTDSDGDDIPDGVEGLIDTDGDGVVDSLDTDSDGDGVGDRIEGMGDFDGDGTPNYLDLDSDGDGLSDEVEGNRNPDGDGQPNFLDLDSDNDGLSDSFEGDGDPDFDGVPNFEDRNSDGQGASDGNEGDGDGDCDGIVDWLDPDEEDSFCDPPQQDPEILPGVDGDPPSDPPRFGAGDYTGGCSTSGTGGLFGLGLWLAAGLTRRRRGGMAVAAGCAVAPLASAQQIDAQRFAPSVGSGFTKLEDLDLPESGTTTAAMWMSYADSPLVFRPDGAERLPLLDAVATANLTAAYSVGFARFGVDLPVHLYTRGVGIDGPTRLGDLRLSAGLEAVERPLGAGVLRLGASADLSLPTGSPTAWVGAGRAWGRGLGVVALGFERWRLSSNLGARTGTGESFGGLVVAPGLVWGLGGAYGLTTDLWASVEVDGDVWLKNPGQPGALPMEWLAGARYAAPGSGWAVNLGAGTGLSRGVGAPALRVVGGVRWSGRKRVLRDDVLLD